MTTALIIIGIVVVGTIVRVAFDTDAASAAAKDLARMPATKVSALADGARARVEGAAVMTGDDFVTAPYSGKPALVVVYERYSSDGRHERGTLLDRQVRHTPFAVDDGSGSITLDFTHARFTLAMSPAELAQRGPNRVFGADIIASNRLAGGELNDEGGVVPGSRLSVRGTVRRSADGGLVLGGTPADPLVVVGLADPS